MGREKYLPGELIYTDQMGPYARSLGGNRYGQVFKDSGSTYRWVFALHRKNDAEHAVHEVIVDSRARSGRPLRFLQTDGDGSFNSKEFEELRLRFGFVHKRSAPHDHDSNPEIESEIRNVFEGAATALQASAGT